MSNLLQLQGGAKHFGARELFREASFAINAGEHVGVIGPNGAGKSTLFKILIGHETLDEGQITRMNGLRVGYLAQEDHWVAETTVEAYLTGLLTPIWELRALAVRMGLTDEMFVRPITNLSGGYRMRVKLLHLLGSQPDLMLLDEPTNYLDLETLLVLEDFLLGFRGAFLLISHDREFLRRTTDHILEIEAGEITKYPGNIDDYFEQKALLREQLEKRALSLAARRAEILDFAARFGAKATKARQVQSRLKSLEKMETIEVKPVAVGAHIRLPTPETTGKSVLFVENVDLGYGERAVLSGVRLELQRGDHLGVVGVNGAGKSTLLKALAGEVEPKAGEVRRGFKVEIAYFAQHVADRLRPEETVLEEMGRFAARDVTRQEVLDLAGSLLFSGDDVEKRIRVLSGGEKSRVALGQVLLRKASCLLLDEPTNHLDFHTVEALTQALQTYPGSVVIVSHDRGFMSRVATKILEIRDGRADFYPGTYDEYVWSTQKGVMASDRASQISASRPSPVGIEKPPSGMKANFKEQKKSWEKDLRQVEKDLARIEKEVEAMKVEIERKSVELTTLTGAAAAVAAKELGLAQARVEQLESDWITRLETREDLMVKIASLLQ
ncbi:MAG: ATP-binding cassette domain-containing protein [Bdellovibrionaceae bacterium]|nr:ATP-binding cassette domain-containing protein [Pseudobdellovibrionaceae bacterium]